MLTKQCDTALPNTQCTFRAVLSVAEPQKPMEQLITKENEKSRKTMNKPKPMKTNQNQSLKLYPETSAAERPAYDVEDRAIDMLVQIGQKHDECVAQLLEHGAGSLHVTSGCFDSDGRITDAGLDAILDAGVIALKEWWRATKGDLMKLTRADISLLRKYYCISRSGEGDGEQG